MKRKELIEASILNGLNNKAIVARHELKEAIAFNQSWFPYRKWLIDNKRPLTDIPEEQKFLANIAKFNLKQLKKAQLLDLNLDNFIETHLTKPEPETEIQEN